MRGIFLDSETNGLHLFKHVPLEIAYKVIEMDTFRELATFSSLVAPTADEWALSDPKSLEINGFSWRELEGAPSRQAVASQIFDQFSWLDIRRGNAFFFCQNPSFDRIFFSRIIDPEQQEKNEWPYHWLDLASMYWLSKSPADRKTITSLSKDQMAKDLHLPPEKKPHRALNGVQHLIDCYRAIATPLLPSTS